MSHQLGKNGKKPASEAGAHRENIVHGAEEHPKRGDYGAGCAIPKQQGVSGARYELPKK